MVHTQKLGAKCQIKHEPGKRDKVLHTLHTNPHTLLVSMGKKVRGGDF